MAILDDESIIVSWLAQGADAAELRVRRYPSNGPPEPAIVVSRIDASRQSGFPRMASIGDAALIVWTVTDGPRIGAAVLSVSGE